MATRSAKSTAKKAKTAKSAKRSAKGVALGNPPKRLEQAKKGRSSERRTTLRVPSALKTQISQVARELGISENQALVHLAALGAQSAKREREVRRVVNRRRAAISKPAGPAAAVFPSPEEMRDAILVDRD
jgi:hypothetical protein